jgi:hypothetical protein
LQTQVLKLGTNKIKNKRGDITDNTTPMVGDILLYQGAGVKKLETLLSLTSKKRKMMLF